MSKRHTPRNRSAREHRRARQAAARAGRADARCPLARHQPPFRGYDRWLAPTGRPADGVGMPAPAATVLEMITALAPLYGGRVPTAALYLEQQLRSGVLRIASFGGGVNEVPVPDMATVLAQTADVFPDAPPEPEDSDDDVGALFHQVHALGFLVLDDYQVLHLRLG